MTDLDPNAIDVCDFARVDRKAKPPVMIGSGPGVYALLDHAGAVVYVGMSSDVARRVGQHWYPRAEVRFIHCDESTARWIEKRLIGIHQPMFNTKGKGRS